MEARLKQPQVSTAKRSIPRSLIVRPGHCSGITGMVRCASAMSLTAASDPGWRCQRRVQTMLKVDHMQGYKSESITWLIEAGEYGNDQFVGNEICRFDPVWG